MREGPALLVPGIHLKPGTLQVVSRDVNDKIKNDRRDSGFSFEVAKFDAHVEARNFIDLLNFKFYSTIGLFHGWRVYLEKRRIAVMNKMSIGVMKKENGPFFLKKKKATDTWSLQPCDLGVPTRIGLNSHMT
jgi:hypothetical protein